MPVFILPYPPSINSYWKPWRGRLVKTSEAKRYQAQVGLLIRSQGMRGPPLEGPVTVTLRLYRPRKIGDIDNAQKCLLDALRKLVFVDDSQVVELHAYRGDDKDNPRAVITVEAA